MNFKSVFVRFLRLLVCYKIEFVLKNKVKKFLNDGFKNRGMKIVFGFVYIIDKSVVG